MIMSMPVGKFVCRSCGVMWVMSSGREVFQLAVAEGGSWPGVMFAIIEIRPGNGFVPCIPWCY